jgi:hypothetical protein
VPRYQKKKQPVIKEEPAAHWERSSLVVLWWYKCFINFDFPHPAFPDTLDEETGKINTCSSGGWLRQMESLPI